MTEKYVEQIFKVSCKGRTAGGDMPLKNAVEVEVNIHQSPDSDTISSTVDCEYHGGAHGEKCRAVSKNNDVICPYSFDIPYALEHLNPHSSGKQQ